eukprot:gene17795-biopygen1313
MRWGGVGWGEVARGGRRQECVYGASHQAHYLIQSLPLSKGAGAHVGVTPAAPTPDPFGSALNAAATPDPFGSALDAAATPDPFGQGLAILGPPVGRTAAALTQSYKANPYCLCSYPRTVRTDALVVLKETNPLTYGKMTYSSWASFQNSEEIAKKRAEKGETRGRPYTGPPVRLQAVADCVQGASNVSEYTQPPARAHSLQPPARAHTCASRSSRHPVPQKEVGVAELKTNRYSAAARLFALGMLTWMIVAKGDTRGARNGIWLRPTPAASRGSPSSAQ